MADNRRITDIDESRLYRTIADLEAAPDPTARWHRMAGVLEDGDGLDASRGIGRGLAICAGAWGVVWALWRWVP
jgi:hypothetical protein